MNKKIGIVNERVIQLLGISIEKNTEIFLGNDNIVHMQKRHLSDYAKYGSEIADIIASHDYVGYHEKDDSIEYVKEYAVNNEFVKVAVRPTRNGSMTVEERKMINKGLYCDGYAWIRQDLIDLIRPDLTSKRCQKGAAF